MTEFKLTYDYPLLVFSTNATCDGCEESLVATEKIAHIQIGKLFLRFHRDCADQLASLLRQFVTMTDESEEIVN